MKAIRFGNGLLGLLFFLVAHPGLAATYTVTNAVVDVNSNGTLRWAILSANTNAGADTIAFNNLLSSVITPTGQLPAVVGANTLIDGTTHAGYSGTPIVRLQGSGSISRGLSINAPSCTVKAIQITRFWDCGIFLYTGRYALVQGCHLLTNGYAGITAAGSWNTIGGTNALQRNVISANTNGVRLSPNYSNNTVIGNFIGTDASGMAANGNEQDGIVIDNNGRNLIGSVTNGARNIIAANGNGIHVMWDNSVDNVIQNNYIGTASNGTTALGNGYGVYVDWASRNRIGGTNAAARNVIAGNREGIRVDQISSSSNVIQGNYIGLDATGAALSNEWYGIHLSSAPSNTIGGAVPGAGNVIACSWRGIYMEGTDICGTVIQGNRIGTDPAGSARRGVDDYGIYLGNSRNTQIGGTNADARNVISGSGRDGIVAAFDDQGGHVIEGNYIGVDQGGTVIISNAWAGVALYGPRSRIGGTNASQRNVISGNGTGISINGTNAYSVDILGNYIGVDVTGMNALGGGAGIRLNSVRDCEVGRAGEGGGNVIAAMEQSGVYLQSGCASNRVANNYIGTDKTGNAKLPGQGWGIIMSDCSPTNVIGGSVAERNVISGGRGSGITVAWSTGTVIRANYIGVGTNMALLGNGIYGVQVQFSRDFDVGGPSASDGNVIGVCSNDGVAISSSSNGMVRRNYIGVAPSGSVISNADSGVYLGLCFYVDVSLNTISASGQYGVDMASSSHNILRWNMIGTDPFGTMDLGNKQDGISITGPSVSNSIGPADGSGGNIISGNEGEGIEMNGSEVQYTTISGNRIGTDTTGLLPLGNGSDGIGSCGASFSIIGGTNAAAKNVISANDGYGVSLGCDGAHSNRIQGNYIGVDQLGTGPLPNVGVGIWLGSGASNNLVGGMDTNARNIVAFNRSRGVGVYTGSGNSILGNSIKRNEHLGIDLGYDGVTANDANDPDVGANLLQNYPVLLSATNDGASVTVVGYLDSLSSRTFFVDVFGNRDPDLTGYGEGEYWMGRVAVKTPAGGTVGFTTAVSVAAGTPNFITAMATETNRGDTSEFSLRLLLDSDGDGMGDGFEFEYYGHHTGADPAGDDDFDGVDNLGEFRAETDPWSASSCLRITQLWREWWGDWYFTAQTSDCRDYSIEYAWDLMSPLTVWWYRGCTMARTNGSVTFNAGSPSDSPVFFRVIGEIP